MNQAVLAMAHHNLDQANDAKVALEKASELITTLNKAGNKGASDLLIAEILFREADAKINRK